MSIKGKDREKALWFIKTLWNEDPEEALEYWEDYCKDTLEIDPESCKVIIAGPSRIVGLLKTKEVDEVDVLKNKWKTYTIKKSFNIKMSIMRNSTIHFDGYFFNGLVLLESLYKLFKDRVLLEVRVVKANKVVVLTFKIDENYSFGCTWIITDDYLIKPEGVWFIDFIDEEDDEGFLLRKVEIKREFFEWKDWIAERTISYGTRSWKNYLIDKNYFFEELSNDGDFGLI